MEKQFFSTLEEKLTFSGFLDLSLRPNKIDPAYKTFNQKCIYQKILNKIEIRVVTNNTKLFFSWLVRYMLDKTKSKLW